MFDRKCFFQSVIKHLTEAEKKQLQELQESELYEYIFFDVSVFNAGAVVNIEPTDDPDEEKTQDGTSFFIATNDLQFFNLE